MADNIELASGSGGAIVRTDDDGTAHWQYFKLAYGADNTQNIVTSTATNPLPVALSDTDNAVLDAIQTAVELIDNAISGTEMQVDVVASLPTGSNTIGDVTVSGAALTALQLLDDVVATLGTTTYTEASTKGTVVGAVRNDTLAALANTDNEIAPLQVNASGALYIQEGSALDVSAATVTVSGTVTADLGATDNAVLDTIAANTNNLTNCIVQDDAPFTPATGYLMMIGGEFDDAAPDSVDEGDAGNVRISANRSMYVQLRDAAGNERGLNVDANGDIGITNANLATLAGAVSGSEMQVDIVSGNVTNAGTFAVQVDGDALTALQTIDNIVATEDGASGGAAVGVPSMAVRDDSLSALTPVEGDYVPLRVNSTGALHVTGGGGGTQYNVGDAAGATDTGTLGLAIRDDSLTTLSDPDGDYVPLRVSSTGALHVTGGGGGTEYTEDVATADPIVGTATMMERDDALGTLTPVEGDWASMRCSAEGALWTQDFNSDAILADTNTIAGAVAGSEMQVDIVSSATLTVDLGANNDVTIDGSNSVYTHDAAGGTANGIMGMSQRDDEVGATAISTADGDAQSLRSNLFGMLKVTQMPDATSEVKYANISAAASGDNQLVAAAGAGIKIRVVALAMIARGDVDAYFRDDAGTPNDLMGDATNKLDLTANSGFVLPFSPVGWFETADNQELNVNLSTTTAVVGCLAYVEV